MSNKYKSTMITLEDLVNGNHSIEKDIKFNIPIYQRLYVWKIEQIQRLLEDTFSAFKNEPKNDYYLGAVIVVKNKERYDLIDGQQRFTTLWLIAKEIKYALEPFLDDRMHFSIREYANEFFNENNSKLVVHDELKNINKAVYYIEEFFKIINDEDIKEFSNYLYTKLKLVFTTVPQNVDLNKLFETINSGGVQLQHHELLKAKMLEQIKNSKEQKVYSKLWDSCAFMDNYIENNLSVSLNCKKITIFNELLKDNIKNIKNPQNVIYFIGNQLGKVNHEDSKSLKDILKVVDITENTVNINDNEDEIKVRSIISFSMLSLHTLRIFFKQNDLNDIKEVKEKELLKIFTSNYKDNEKEKYGVFKFNEDNVKEFIQLLWKVRFAFDEHIIKWVKVEDNTDERHLICKIYPNTSSSLLQRLEQENSKSFSLLQSMLYHTQPVINHYWLTPLLYKLINNTDSNEQYLQELDNYLFFPKKDGDLRTNTWGILNNENLVYKNNCNNILSQFDLNTDATYTQFSHYLFYKIEYILWKEGYVINNEVMKQNKDFYFRAKNSVEHISPQNPNRDNYQEENLVKDSLHSFGNLALISRERNSEFGNNPFKFKQIDFKTRKDDASSNLKLSLIYDNESWGDAKCQEHLNYLMGKVKVYMSCEDSNKPK